MIKFQYKNQNKIPKTSYHEIYRCVLMTRYAGRTISDDNFAAICRRIYIL